MKGHCSNEVYYELFQSQSPCNKTFEKVPAKVGQISVPDDDSDVGDLIDAIYAQKRHLLSGSTACSVMQLSAYPNRTDTKSPTLKQELIWKYRP
jgi:hypothetical protein